MTCSSVAESVLVMVMLAPPRRNWNDSIRHSAGLGIVGSSDLRGA